MLDLDAVHAFIRVAELQSFTRAAELLDSTQSAVSLKIQRLERSLGRRLFERTPRHVGLSADGRSFLASARTLLAAHEAALGAFTMQSRRLVVGLSHHVVGAELPLLVKRMTEAEPGLVLELRIASSSDLLLDLDAGSLDAAIVLQHDRRRDDGDVILTEQFAWMAAPEFSHQAGVPLRLATQSTPCSVRTMAVQALDGAGIPWTEVFVGGGIATIGAAVAAGLAVAALGRRVAPAGSVDVGERFGLPPLPSRAVMLHTRLSDARAKAAFRALTAAIRAAVR